MRSLFTIVLIAMAYFNTKSQESFQKNHLIGIYVDNDFINIRGDGTDRGYSSGLSMGFTENEKKSFLNKWLKLRGGTARVNSFTAALTHIIITPQNLHTTDTQRNDYPFSGALYIYCGKQSLLPDKKINIAISLAAGVMGPWSVASQVQSFFHKLIGDNEPVGWDNQLPEDILLNLSIAGEKGIFRIGNDFETISGLMLNAGSMLVSAELYSIIRAGIMNSYFQGLNSHYSGKYSINGKTRRFQLYFLFKPVLSYTIHNSLLQGGIILNKKAKYHPSIVPFTTRMEGSLFLCFQCFSVSFTQKWYSAQVSEQYRQEVGNISLTYSW